MIYLGHIWDISGIHLIHILDMSYSYLGHAWDMSWTFLVHFCDKGVPIPPLGMVDDIVTVTSVEKSKEVNKLINTFFEQKKLKLSSKKCVRIHIGNGHQTCPKLKVHEEDMKEADHEKYLGDIIDKSGSINQTIEKRKARGDGIVSEILSIIKEIPLGRHNVKAALQLRESMLINGMLFNSEAWHGLTNAQLVKLESVDQALLRGILKCHSKTPKEFLHLESGTVPLRWIITQRRLNYLRHISGRPDNELLKRVFLAQKEQPTKGCMGVLRTN